MKINYAYYHVLYLWLLISLPGISYAQNLSLDQIKQKESLADSITSSNPTKARKLYQEVAYAYANRNDLAKQTHVLIKNVTTYRLMDLDEESFQLMDSVEHMILQNLPPNHINLGRLYYHKGVSLNEMNFPDSALNYFNKSIAILDKSDEVSNSEKSSPHGNIAIIYFKAGQYQKAIQKYKTTIDLKLSETKVEPSISIEYGNMAIAYLELGDVQLADEYVRKSLEIKLEAYGEKNLSTSFAYRLTGIINFYSQNYKTAIDNLKKALKIRNSILSSSSRVSLNIQSNISDAFVNLQQFDSAIHYAVNPASIYKKSFPSDFRNIARNYNAIAGLYSNKGAKENNPRDFDTSHKYLDSLKLLIDNGLFDIRLKSDYYKQRAINLIHQNMPKKGLAFCQQGLNIMIPSVSSTDISENFKEVDFFYAKRDIIELLGVKLRGLISLMKKDASATTNELLKDTYATFDRLIDEILFSTYSPNANSETLREFRTYYEEYLNFLTQSADRESTLQAFLLVESLRAKALKYKGLLDQVLSGSSDEIEQNQEMAGKIEQVQSALLSLNPEDQSLDLEKKKLQDSLFDLRKQHAEVKKKLLEKAAQNGDAQIVGQQTDIEKTMKILGQRKQTMVTFFMGIDKVYAFVLDQHAIKLKKINLDTAAIRFINQSSLLNASNSLVDNQLAFKVYQQLFAPLEINTPNIVVVPEGALWNLNFEALLTEVPTTNDKRSFPYLLRKHAISYAYSSLVLVKKEKKPRTNQKNLLAFSFGESDKGNGGSRTLHNLRDENVALPGSREEIRAISRLIDGDYFFGDQASEQKFKELAPHYNILHLAVHGKTSDLTPDNSKLSFFGDSDHSDDDGFLHTFELYNMSLSSDLAVLSACNTGSGKVVSGEGIMSLGRAFSYAGVNSLLLTRWEVSDAFTPQIMKAFYRELKAGKTKSEALRTAKLEFLENADNITADPFYWASFYIIGDDAPVDFDNGSNFWGYALLITGVITMFLLILWKQKRRQTL